MTAPMTPEVAAVLRAIKEDSDYETDEDHAIAVIIAFLDNLDREAMRQALHLFGITYGSTEAIVDAALAAVRPCPAGGEEG